MESIYKDKEIEEGLDEPMVQSEVQSDASDSDTPPKKKVTLNWREQLSNLRRGKWLRAQWGIILLIVFYCLLVVSNRYEVENLSKEKIEVQKRIEYLREQRIQMQKEYQESIKISRIASELDSSGVQLISGPPYEIEVDK